MCLSNIWKDFTIDNMNKIGLHEYVYNFSVDFNTTDISDIVDIDKYLKTWYKTVIILIKWVFTSVLAGH